jgi:hypothetical protein
MVGMTATAGPDAEHGRIRSRLDEPVLASNLVSGVLFLGPCLLFAGPALFLIGAVYVVAGSVFFAAAYARERLSVRQELFVWVAP